MYQAEAFAGRIIKVRGFCDCAAFFMRKNAFTSALAAVESEVGVLFNADLISLLRFQSNKAFAMAFAGRLVEVRGCWDCAAVGLF